MVFRILITGSRTWDDVQAIRDALRTEWLAAGSPRDAVLVSGACPKGADMLAEHVWSSNGLTVERHPAQWKVYGPKSAGIIRNTMMVALGADVCVAFIKDQSNGASHAAREAERAGIRTVRVIRETSDMEDAPLTLF